MHKIENLIVGIRFARSFRIPDIAGEIVDEILHGDKTPFGTNFFPNINDYPDEKFLFHKDSKDFFRINSDEIVLKISIRNIEKDFKNLLEVLIPYLATNIISKYKIKNFSRFGIIFSHKFNSSKILHDLVKNFSNGKIEEPNNVHLSFTKKLASSGSNISGVQDNINTIFSFIKVENKMIAELDYQKYFSPLREDIRDAKIEEFINDARKYLVNEVHPLLKDYEE